MLAYILRRLALIPLTLLGIIAINFAIVQIAPGGPMEQLLAQLKNTAVSATVNAVATGDLETVVESTLRPWRGYPHRRYPGSAVENIPR